MMTQIYRKAAPKAATLSLALLSARLASAPMAAHAGGTNLETFVMATQGTSSNPQSSVPDAVYQNFGGYGDAIPADAHSDPSVLASESVKGTYRVTDSATASKLTDSYAISGTGDTSRESPYAFSGSTTATAAYGQLKSGSQATISGIGGAAGNPGYNATNTAESYATMLETLSTSSTSVANGQSGTMTIAFSLDGSLTSAYNPTNPFFSFGSGIAGIDFTCASSTNGSTPNLAFGTNLLFGSLNASRSSDTYFLGSYNSNGLDETVGTPPGMTYTVGSALPAQPGAVSNLTLSGYTTVYANIPIIFGAATTLNVGLFTYVDAIQESTVSSFFNDTATISGIQVFDKNGNAVNDFSIASGSGTQYDKNGVHLTGAAAAPEPGSLFLLMGAALGGLPVVGIIARRRGWGEKPLRL